MLQNSSTNVTEPKFCDGHSVPSPIFRKFNGDQDLSALVELFNACASQNEHEHATNEEELRSDLARPEIDVSSNVILVQAGDHLLGFAALLIQPGSRQIDIAVWMQALLDDPSRVETGLVRWIVDRAGQMSEENQRPVEILAFVGEHRLPRAAAFKVAGFTVVRKFVEMRCRLGNSGISSPHCEGYSIRPIAGEKEIPNWVAALNDSFAEQWRYHEATIEQTIHFARHDPCYRPQGDFVAISPEGSIAGLCQCVIRVDDSRPCSLPVGRVALLGVCPAHRRVGLGSALLRTGLRWLQNEGVNEASLGTDANDVGSAMSLYQRTGFEVIHQRQAYLLRIDQTKT